MNQIKNFLQDKKGKYLIIGLVSLFLLFFLVMLIFFLIGKKITYSELENELYFATQKFLKDNPDYSPVMEGAVTTLTADELVNRKYIKPLDKLVKDQCSAEITIQSINKVIQIKPFLTCDNYESQLFFDKILKDNPITTTSSGLYDLNEHLVFRGDRVNNYAKFHNKLWRIVKMDPVTEQVTLILDNVKEALNDKWDNRYNAMEDSSHGINDFSVSVIRYTLEELFDRDFSDAKSRMVPMHACIGKRSNTETLKDGSIECSNMFEEETFLSLLPVYDYMNASTDIGCNTIEDRSCSNYNYLVAKAGKWWTITADGGKGTKVYGINYNGEITSDHADSKRYLRYTIVVDGTNLYQQGNGTMDNPYMMK